MKYSRILGLLAVAGAALMAVAATASATTITDESGNHYPVGTIIKAESEPPSTQLDGTISIACAKSELEAEVTNTGGLGTDETVQAKTTKLTFAECGNHTLTVTKNGTLEIHTDTEASDGNGTLTSTGAEVTVLTHSFFLGTRHCIYVTNGSTVGTLTGSTNTGGHATLDIGSSAIAQTATDSLCGNDSEWTGSYTLTKPAYLDVD